LNTINTEHVKSFFDQPDRYLKGNLNIRFRAAAVAHFTGGISCRSILDIGCGNGSISIPLLRDGNRLTLLDLSANMLSVARAHVPRSLITKVDFVNADFMTALLEPRTYDLILCLGVLAHTESPISVIWKMRTLLSPGGSVIAQNTDRSHPIRYLLDLWTLLRTGALPGAHSRKKRGYAMHHLADGEIMAAFASQGLAVREVYRYNDQIPGMARLLGHDLLYRIIQRVYGTADENRRAWLGTECIYHFQDFSSRRTDDRR
jgi:ubiquinone/menaquinone biosynthesis C-methylase UbiE